MRRIYTAASLPEAHLVRQMLEAESIRSAVFNENAQGAAGELPITEVWPEVWIEDERCQAVARSIIERYETSGGSNVSVLCNRCGEYNPENFELCWQCGEVLPSGDKGDLAGILQPNL